MEGGRALPLEAFLAGREVRAACSKGLPGAEHSPEGPVGFSWWSCPSGTRCWTPPLLRAATPGCWVRPPGHLDSHPFIASVSLAKRANQEAERAQSGLRSVLSLASSFPWERPLQLAPLFLHLQDCILTLLCKDAVKLEDLK